MCSTSLHTTHVRVWIDPQAVRTLLGPIIVELAARSDVRRSVDP